jgi:hypothetical protein
MARPACSGQGLGFHGILEDRKHGLDRLDLAQALHPPKSLPSRALVLRVVGELLFWESTRRWGGQLTKVVVI